MNLPWPDRQSARCRRSRTRSGCSRRRRSWRTTCAHLATYTFAAHTPQRVDASERPTSRDIDDDDELFAELEKELDNGDEWSSLRERRYEEMKQEFALTFSSRISSFFARMERAQRARESRDGSCEEIVNEKEALHISA